MSATHTHLTQRHHSLLGSRAELERVREDLAKMRQFLAELPARIASAEEYEGVLTRHVELERDLLREESSRTGWEPPQQAVPAGPPAPPVPAAPPALIGDRLERERSGSYPITQPVTPAQGVPTVRVAEPGRVAGDGRVDCAHCTHGIYQPGDGPWLHLATNGAECAAEPVDADATQVIPAQDGGEDR